MGLDDFGVRFGVCMLLALMDLGSFGWDLGLQLAYCRWGWVTRKWDIATWPCGCRLRA